MSVHSSCYNDWHRTCRPAGFLLYITLDLRKVLVDSAPTSQIEAHSHCGCYIVRKRISVTLKRKIYHFFEFFFDVIISTIFSI